MSDDGRPRAAGLPPWRLPRDLAWAHVLVWLAHPSAAGELRAEVHLFLAGRYGRRARHHRRLGHAKRAVALDHEAEEQFRLGGGGLVPPAAGMAMPVTRPKVRLDAIARPEPRSPDDAA